jgi:Tol biopolymer transport system component
MKVSIKPNLIEACLFALFTFSCCSEDDLINPADYEMYITISNDKYPAVSPDGSLIAYYHVCMDYPEPEDYPTGLYVMSADGVNRRLLLKGFHFSPSWSPDGQWLVFTSGGALQIISIDGDSIRTFQGILNLSLYSPDWSKDGKEILFSAPLTLEGGVFAMTPDFNHVRRVLSPIENNGMYARWSPDRNRIVYEKGNQAWKSTEIFTFDTLLATEVRLTIDGRDDREPSWSPTGELISWSSNVEIYRMDTDGNNRQRLSYGQYPCFTPDGQFIVYSFANRDYSKGVLWRIGIDGKNKTQLTF